MPRNCSTAACQSARLQRGSRLHLRTEPGHPHIGGDEDADGVVDLLGVEVVVKQEEDLCGRAKWRCCGCLAAVITQKLHVHARSAAMALGAAPNHCCQDCPLPFHGPLMRAHTPLPQRHRGRRQCLLHRPHASVRTCIHPFHSSVWVRCSSRERCCLSVYEPATMVSTTKMNRKVSRV